MFLKREQKTKFNRVSTKAMNTSLTSLPNDRDNTAKTEKRMTVVLPAETARVLEILSELQSISLNESIRRAISTEAFIQHEIRKNSKILLETEDGKIKELIFR